MGTPACSKAALFVGVFTLFGGGSALAKTPADLYAADGAAPADIYRAWELFREVSEYTSAGGELRLADLSQLSRDNYRSAYYWWKRAAALGSGIAAANLWYMYATGHGAVADRESAASFRDEAALSDEGAAQLFALQMKMAVDRARPASASGRGTALVAFDHAGDGKASGVTLYGGSGDADLDAAAVQAVEDADLPPVPEGFARHHFVISVSFGPGN